MHAFCSGKKLLMLPGKNKVTIGRNKISLTLQINYKTEDSHDDKNMLRCREKETGSSNDDTNKHMPFTGL